MIEWKRIEEFKDYLISSNGKCFSLKTNKLLTPHQYPNDYWFYTFKIDGKQHSRLISRLVAIAFIPNPHNKPQVGHWDCDKTNNKVENLYLLYKLKIINKIKIIINNKLHVAYH